MSKYQLMYFNGRGRAELARWVFAAAGQEYEDIRLKKEEWPAKKPDTPFGQLPLLIVDEDFKLAQSNSIGRFLGKRLGFVGGDEFEEGRCNMILDCVEDFIQAMMRMMMGDNDAVKAAAKEKWVGGLRDDFLTKFEKLLTTNKGGDGFFVGSGLTIADMAFCLAVSYLDKGGEFDEWHKYPKIAGLRKRVEEGNEKIANWIAARPKTEF